MCCSKLFRKLDTRNNNLTEQAGQDFKDFIKEHEACGLTYSGLNAEGEPEFIGTTKQWGNYEKLINK